MGQTVGELIPVITIDGPSGSGKGTVSRLVAEHTGFHLLDSGAIYRLAALEVHFAQVNIALEASVVEALGDLDIRFEIESGQTHAYLAGRNVSKEIRQEEIGMVASKIATYPEVRKVLLKSQRDFARIPGLVADGRDMGTVVFPDAPLKVFLTASVEERAARRFRQLQLAGEGANLEKITSDIEERDFRDANRASAPLIPAQDAIIIDSTNLSIQEVVEKILSAFHPDK